MRIILKNQIKYFFNPKTFMITLLMFLGLSSFAFENLEVKPDSRYLYFSDTPVEKITVSDKSKANVYVLTTLADAGKQVMIETFSPGFAVLEIKTANKSVTFILNIKSKPALGGTYEKSPLLYEIDLP